MLQPVLSRNAGTGAAAMLPGAAAHIVGDADMKTLMRMQNSHDIAQARLRMGEVVVDRYRERVRKSEI